MLKVSLAERESIERRLSELYGGAQTAREERLIEKAENRRYKEAKAVRKSLYRLDAKLEKLHASLDLKKAVRECFNKKITAYSNIAYAKYLLRKQKPQGKRKQELRDMISDARKTLRYVDKDIRYYMKKAMRDDFKYKDDILWGVTMISLLLLVAALAILWYYYGNTVTDFLKTVFKGG